MNIISKRFEEWPKNIQRRLLRATFHDGSMRFCVRQKPSTVTFVAFASNGNVMGWFVVWPTPQEEFATVFVNKYFRGKGVADALFDAALGVHFPLTVLGWDKYSTRLFTKVQKRNPGKLIIKDWLPYREKYGQLQDNPR